MKHLSLTLLALMLCLFANAQLPAPITGPTGVCDGSVITLADVTPGGVWSSSSPAIASVGSATGVVTGTAAGMTTISYTTSGGSATVTVTVFPLPATIGGTFSVCPGSSATLTDATGGGLWSSGSPGVAVIGSATGVYSGVSAGVSFITYSLGTGCFVTHPITVDVAPGALTGSSTLCVGSSTTWTCSPTGGTWTSSTVPVATIGFGTGVITGVSVGTTTIAYVLPTGCANSRVLTVTPSSVSVYSVVGTGSYCAGGSGVTVGLTWSDLGVSYTTFLGGTPVGSPVTGTGTSLPLGTFTGAGVYTVVANYGTSCSATMAGSATITINPLPTAYVVTGGGTVCSGGPGVTIGLASSSTGITYQLYNGSTAVGSAIAGTGAPISFGTFTTAGTYTVVATNTSTTCTNNMTGSVTITVVTTPTITVSGTAGCGGTTTLTGGGGTTYTWSPSTGLSCTACSSTIVSPGSTTTYVVTGTTSGCSDTAMITVDGNRISGYITYSGGTLSDTFKVWLIHYNPLDSSIVAMDSTYSCMVGGTPYYQFMDPAAGSYMVKARLLGTVPGTSGYIPTYSLSTPNWYSAASTSHTTGWDTMHINMVYGTVPSGPGFISGYVYAGAGKGTSGDYPEPGMLVYLKNTSGTVLTYTYTDAAGAYTFTGLAYGSYVIYPTEFDYYTTPASTITLSSSIPSVTGLYYKKHTSYGTITPLTTTIPVTENDKFAMYPNPTTGGLNIEWIKGTTGSVAVSIYDMTGREVYTTSGAAANNGMLINICNLQAGIYQVNVKAETFVKNEKLLIQH